MSHLCQFPGGFGIDAESGFRLFFSRVHICLGGAVDEHLCLSVRESLRQDTRVAEIHATHLQRRIQKRVGIRPTQDLKAPGLGEEGEVRAEHAADAGDEQTGHFFLASAESSASIGRMIALMPSTSSQSVLLALV